jgi:hypothetical protein
MVIGWERVGNLRMTLARDLLYELRFCALVVEPIGDVPLNKVPGVLIAVGCIREAMHHWESRQLVPYFLACP